MSRLCSLPISHANTVGFELKRCTRVAAKDTEARLLALEALVHMVRRGSPCRSANIHAFQNMDRMSLQPHLRHASGAAPAGRGNGGARTHADASATNSSISAQYCGCKLQSRRRGMMRRLPAARRRSTTWRPQAKTEPSRP